jgi:cellobiose epimerase
MEKEDIILLSGYKSELHQELENILRFWQTNMPDYKNGGFYGRIDGAGNLYPDAPKGSVLNSRILWTFSAAYQLTKNVEHLDTAQRAFEYLQHHFLDQAYGGVYWTVDKSGIPLDAKKQIYALAFAIYGCSEYFVASGDQTALELATGLFEMIETNSFDTRNGGYIEAFSRDWQVIADLRLSEKDANESKTMNTHLHILEAYANLYRAWPDENLKAKISGLLGVFQQYIFDNKNHHLVLFHDESWNKKSSIISYGHDIEAAWLLLEAAKIINDEQQADVSGLCLKLALAAAEGLDKDGGLWYEYEQENNHLVREKHWWPQAEAMIGFFHAWQISNEAIFLQRSINSWRFVKDHLIDKQNGEWFWGVNEKYELIEGDKAGIWKCPYHNSRACIQIIHRLQDAGIY